MFIVLLNSNEILDINSINSVYITIYKPTALRLAVRLYDGTSASLQMQSRAGALLFYNQNKDKWSLVCDDHQADPDLTARIACQEMNFVDGRVLHSSAYGDL